MGKASTLRQRCRPLACPSTETCYLSLRVQTETGHGIDKNDLIDQQVEVPQDSDSSIPWQVIMMLA